MQKLIDKLKAENSELKSNVGKPKPLACKIGLKGGVSVSGLNKQFPVTLFQDQWLRLDSFMPIIKQFIIDNKDKLSVKGQEYTPTPEAVASNAKYLANKNGADNSK